MNERTELRRQKIVLDIAPDYITENYLRKEASIIFPTIKPSPLERHSFTRWFLSMWQQRVVNRYFSSLQKCPPFFLWISPSSLLERIYISFVFFVLKRLPTSFSFTKFYFSLDSFTLASAKLSSPQFKELSFSPHLSIACPLSSSKFLFLFSEFNKNLFFQPLFIEVKKQSTIWFYNPNTVYQCQTS